MNTWVSKTQSKTSPVCSETLLRMLSLARILLILGVVLTLTGGVLYLLAKTGLNLGQLPGNIKISCGNTTCVFGLGVSLLLSLILTILLNVLARFLNK